MSNKPLLVLENIRSAYNTGTMIRTADGLGYDVVLSGYTPHPETEAKVRKSSLGAESTVGLQQFRNTSETITYLKDKGYVLIALEITDESVALDQGDCQIFGAQPVALIVGNEKTGMLQETLDVCDLVVHIPMQGIKESLNVAEAASIGMREMREGC